MSSRVFQGGLALLGFITVKTVVKLLVGVGVGATFTASEIEASKREPWPTDFRRAFIDACESDGDEAGVNLKKYCGCMAYSIENAHILPTKYNTLTSSEERAGNEMAKILEDFLASPVGISITERCLS